MLLRKKRLRELGEEIISLKEELAALRQLILKISTGNKGVPTDSQQTDNQQISDKQAAQTADKQTEAIPDIQNVGFISDLKKDFRSKFLALTTQEFFIFTEIYILEEKQGAATYRDIAKMTCLTESSIRDYIARLIRRGIPIIKRKVNNKNILLGVSPDLRSLFTLDSLVKLREIQDKAFNQRDKTKDESREAINTTNQTNQTKQVYNF